MDSPGNFIPEALIHEFDRYWLNRMKPDERKQFDRRLAEEPQLRAQFEEYRTMAIAIGEAALRERLDEFHSNLEDTGTGKVVDLFSRVKRIHWAAAALVAILTIPLWLQLQDETGKQDLFGKHFRPDPGLPTVMGESRSYLFYEGMVDYKRGAYDTAIGKWESLPSTDTIAYFLGVAYLANDAPDRAIGYLKGLAEVNTSVFREETLYYLGMSYLRKGQEDRAREYLSQSKSPKALEVLKSMD